MTECGRVIRCRYSSALTHTGYKSLSGALRGLIASNINQTNESVGEGAERGCGTENFISKSLKSLPEKKTLLLTIVNRVLGYVSRIESPKNP